MKEFNLKEEYIELDDLLKVMGLCTSGGMAKTAIIAGLVKVDGTVELLKRRKIRKGSIVEFQNHVVKVTSEKADG
jgi:ribosome-associated protein